MVTELVVRFPLGRYHATPWGRNPNEGVVEWPPSPWRLLRALYATWRNREPDLDPEVVLGLLDALADAPVYLVPAHATAHTRHYLPGPAHKAGVVTDTTKVLDAFVSVDPRAELAVRWEVDLPVAQREAFERLAGSLSYLGRAESVCDAEVRVVADEEPRSGLGTVCAPLADEDGRADSIDVLVPTRPLAEAALTITTAAVRGGLRRREPPETRRVRYPRPVAGVGPGRPPIATLDRPTAVRWAIASSARPSRFTAVAWTDTLRRAAMSKYGGGDKRPAPGLSGRTADGALREDQHRHVHWLAFGEKDDPRLSWLVAWAPEGFDDDVLDALVRVRRLSGRPGVKDTRSSNLGVEGWGTIDEVAPELVRSSRVWESYTPFSPTRHAKGGRLEEHVRVSVAHELRWRRPDHPDVEVGRIDGPWSSFRTHRPSGERLRDARRAMGLRLTFEEEITGPLVLGALSHFGLGLFVPMHPEA